ncbi:MAG TPA: ATP-binding protein [Candidatus Kapabacteria bacterium]|nr:ATP-binding protein [Candidatus Kapabacteria bacterium]
MNAKRLRAIIEEGETDTVEFKRKFSGFEKIAKEMIALANTRGGMILVGVDDDGSIVGVESEKSEIDLLSSSAEFYCDPPVDYDIDVVDIEDTDVIVVHIPESRQKPHKIVYSPSESTSQHDARETGVYIRQGEKSVMASREVARVLAASQPDAPPLRVEIGSIERTLFDHLEQHERITLREFRRLVNISERRASRSLVRLVRAGLIRIFTNQGEDYYTLA